jgi:2'-5' RNA ligase
MVVNKHQLVIVALPSADDMVRKFSSEKEPHLTLLYLGDYQYTDAEMTHITEYVEHAASLLPRFGLDVVSRGVLGDKNADVLFFNKKWSKDIATFRSNLLADPVISKGFLSTDQFPDWNPHLTMGYPETPAKKDTRDYPGFSWVNFDRIALWTGDYTGPTFQLSTHDLEVAMSQIERGRAAMGDVLEHYGVKGMKWGVRRSQAQLDAAPSHSPSTDSSTAAKAVDKASNAGGLHVLSNQELQQAITRMNLESQYHNLSTSAHKSEIDRGLQSTQKLLKIGKTAEDVRKFLNTPTGKAVKTGVSAAFTAATAYATGGSSAAAKVGAGLVVRRAANHFTNVGQ